MISVARASPSLWAVASIGAAAFGALGGVGASGWWRRRLRGGGRWWWRGLSCSLVSGSDSALPIVRRQPFSCAHVHRSPCAHAHQGSVVLGMCQAGRASSAVAAGRSPRNGAAMRNSGAAMRLRGAAIAQAPINAMQMLLR